VSAVVVVDEANPITSQVEVPAANGFTVNDDGRLVLLTSSWGGDAVATFRATRWAWVIITPNRGPDGKFVKRGAR
jgi:hypothetical protein